MFQYCTIQLSEIKIRICVAVVVDVVILSGATEMNASSRSAQRVNDDDYQNDDVFYLRDRL